MKKILFVVNTLEFFLSHRLPLAIAAKQAGYEVHIAAASNDKAIKLQEYDFKYYALPFSRSGQNPIYEIKTVFKLLGLFRYVKPDLVHLITIKPVLYGGIVARLSNIKAVVSAVSGLGTVFIAGSGLIPRVRRKIVTTLYSFAFRHKNMAVIFQNPDDRDKLLSLGAVNLIQTRMIRGSGVNLASYRYLSEPDGKPVAVMAARLLRDKGVLEFVEAARLLKIRGLDIEMRLIGSPDPGNPTSVTLQELERWERDGYVSLLGYCEDIAQQYSAANIICLPSYREGLPKSLVEAAACGRAVVTTDVPGCRDAIIANVTGILVPVKDAHALADAIQELVENPDKRLVMGAEGRKLAEAHFSIENIVGQHMKIYEEVLQNA